MSRHSVVFATMTSIRSLLRAALCAICEKLDHDILPFVRTRDLAGILLVIADPHNPTVLALHNDEDAARQRVVPLRRKIFHERSRPLDREPAFAQTDQVLNLHDGFWPRARFLRRVYQLCAPAQRSLPRPT